MPTTHAKSVFVNLSVSLHGRISLTSSTELTKSVYVLLVTSFYLIVPILDFRLVRKAARGQHLSLLQCTFGCMERFMMHFILYGAKKFKRQCDLDETCLCTTNDIVMVAAEF